MTSSGFWERGSTKKINYAVIQKNFLVTRNMNICKKYYDNNNIILSNTYCFHSCTCCDFPLKRCNNLNNTNIFVFYNNMSSAVPKIYMRQTNSNVVY